MVIAINAVIKIATLYVNQYHSDKRIYKKSKNKTLADILHSTEVSKLALINTIRSK